MSADILKRANAITEDVLAKIPPDHLGLASPCASWKVRDVVNHVVGNNFWFEAIARDGVAPDRPDNAAPDAAAGDYLVRFREGSAKAVAAFEAAGDKTVNLPWAQMPASVFVVMASADQYVHGWDLAHAIGQTADLDPELASEFLGFYRQAIPDEFRGPTRLRRSGRSSPQPPTT